MSENVNTENQKQIKKKMRLSKRIFEDVPAFFQELEFRPAANLDEFKQASHLVYKEYLSRDYIQPNPHQLDFSLFQMIPTTVTFVAIHRKTRVLGTVTLVADAGLMLPMDKIYSDELDALRDKGERLAEAGRLAVDEDAMATPEFKMSRSQRLLFLFSLYAALLTYFRDQKNLTQLVACFHPRHEFIYDFMGFLPLGGLKAYESVQGSPAVARAMRKKDILIKVLAEPEYQNVIFFWDKPTHVTKPLKFSRTEFAELFMEKSSVYQSATPEQRAIIDRGNAALGQGPNLLEILAATPKTQPAPRSKILINERILVIGTNLLDAEALAAKLPPHRAKVHLVDGNLDESVIRSAVEGFRPTTIVVRRARLALVLLDETLTEAKRLVVHDRVDDTNQDDLLAAALFCPPISNDSQLLSWDEFLAS